MGGPNVERLGRGEYNLTEEGHNNGAVKTGNEGGETSGEKRRLTPHF